MRGGKTFILSLIVAALALSACGGREPTTVATAVATSEGRPADESGADETYVEVPAKEGEETAPDTDSTEEPVTEERLEAGKSDGGSHDESAVEATPAPAQDIEIHEIEELQAGQCDDNLRFDEFKALIRDLYPAHLDLIEDRVVISVQRPDGSPVHGALVDVEGQQELLLRAGSDGKVYLFPGLYRVEAPIRAQVRCPGAGAGQVEPEALPQQGHYGEQVTVELPCAQPQQVLLDVVYLHDVTGSMQDEMTQLQATTERVMAMLEDAYGQSQGMIRVGGVLYRDRGDDFITEMIDFDTPGGFSRTFRQFGAYGGGDKPESVNAGLEEALRMDWREEAIKVVVLVGDAAPHDYADDPWDRYLDLSKEAVQRGVRLHTISASGMRDRGELAWREMAVISGGKFVFLTYEGAAESEPGGETTRHVEGYNVDDLGSIVFSLLKQEIENQR